MVYMGSKSRIAKEIVPIIQSYIDDNNIHNYLEPFCGGGNVIDKVKCEHKYASDVQPYLIALLKQTQKDTSVFPETITLEEYKDVKDNKEKYPAWYVGLVGFCASYKSKFFGGYAKDKEISKGKFRRYINEQIRNLIKQSSNLKDISFTCCDFRNIKPTIKNFVIYCDIPYKNSTKYKVDDFPYDEFYDWCKQMAKNNIVLVSEYNMPDDFECIWQKEIKTSLCIDRAKTDSKRVEKLFIINSK